MSNTSTKFRSDGIGVVGKFFIAIVIFFLLLALGMLTALLPGFIARLLPLLIFFILIFLAYLSKSGRPIDDGTLKVWSALLLATMALWPTYMLIKVGSLPTLDARRIVAGLSIVTMFFFMISRKSDNTENSGAMRELKIGSALVCIYALWRFMSCIVSPAPIASFITILWELIYYYSMFFVGALFFGRTSIQTWIMTVFMGLALLISIYAGIEWLMGKNLLLQFAPTGEEFAEFRKSLALSRLRDGFFRAQATFEHPLLLAEFSVMAVCFSTAAILWSDKTRSVRFLASVTLIAAIAAALFSGSRSALISVLIGGGGILMLRLFSPKQLILGSQSFFRKMLFVMVIIGMVGIAVPTVMLIAAGKSNSEISSTQGRIYMLEQGLESIKNNPVLGTGPGTAGEIAGLLTGSGLTTLDNYFLAVAIDSGIPALLLLLACLLYPAGVIFNRLLSGVQHSAAFLAATLGCLLVTTLIHTILYMPYNMFFTFLFSGSALASISASNRKEQS
jgi:O-antigen ligase